MELRGKWIILEITSENNWTGLKRWIGICLKKVKIELEAIDEQSVRKNCGDHEEKASFNHLENPLS